MWPWEHLAVGYLCYSAYTHLRGAGGPSDGAAVALAVGTQFPDLVDKPLSWTLSVLPSGQSLAHSLVVAVPVSVAAVAAGRRVGHRNLGAAFAVGYLSHLPGDVVYAALLGGGGLNTDFLLWPFVQASSDPGPGFLERFRLYFSDYAAVLASGEATAYVAIELGLLAAVLALWVYDGVPGVGAFRRLLSPRRTAE